MPAPIKKDEPTGNPKRLVALLLVLVVIGGTLFYAARLPGSHTASKTDAPQVEGVTTDTSPQDEETAPDETQPDAAPTADITEKSYKVVEAVDGDTIKVSIDGKTETIRLIGVDTPETKDPRKKVQCFGKQASDYTKTSLLNNDVRLAGDDSQENRDKYGRLLRYVFLTDGTNFNGQLINEGYAYEYTYDVPYMYQSEFKAFQSSAEAAQKGLWAPTTCNGKR